jgi:predicted transcriptional regulator
MPFYNTNTEASLMSVPCEVAVKCLLPVVRAMVAKELMANYGLKQADVAHVLGVSQPAISLYSRNIRGTAIDLENDREIQGLITNLAKSLGEGHTSRSNVVLMYCEICRTIRAKGLLCRLHKVFDPLVEIDKCELCVNGKAAGCM